MSRAGGYRVEIRNGMLTLRQHDTQVTNEVLGRGGFGRVLAVPVSFVDGTSHTEGHFKLVPGVDTHVAAKIHFADVDDERLASIRDNLNYINNNAQCRDVFVPTILVQTSPLVTVMKLCRPCELWTDTDAKLREVVEMLACMSNNFIASKRVYADFKYPNLGELGGRIVFLDTEEFSNVDIFTMISVWGFETDAGANDRRVAHEKKIVLWVFIMYLVYKYRVYIPYIPFLDSTTQSADATLKFWISHITGATPVELERLQSITVPPLLFTSFNTQLFDQLRVNAAMYGLRDAFHPFMFIFVDVLNDETDTFSRYRRYLAGTVIPLLAARAAGGKHAKSLNAWAAFLGADTDESITIPNMQRCVIGDAHVDAQVETRPWMAWIGNAIMVIACLSVLCVLTFFMTHRRGTKRRS